MYTSHQQKIAGLQSSTGGSKLKFMDFFMMDGSTISVDKLEQKDTRVAISTDPLSDKATKTSFLYV